MVHCASFKNQSGEERDIAVQCSLSILPLGNKMHKLFVGMHTSLYCKAELQKIISSW